MKNKAEVSPGKLSAQSPQKRRAVSPQPVATSPRKAVAAQAIDGLLQQVTERSQLSNEQQELRYEVAA